MSALEKDRNGLVEALEELTGRLDRWEPRLDFTTVCLANRLVCIRTIIRQTQISLGYNAFR